MTIIGQSESIQEVRSQIDQVALTASSVLILGESGTGKELVAQAIHAKSPRSNKAFVPLNCGAIPAELLESELFGHEKGAFTGAMQARAGRFEMAHQGTLFLDEIGDMPVAMQVKLLRVLQEKTFERVGGTRSCTTDTRIIAATHQRIEERIEQGLFRHDLFYRINVFPIHLPPLRARKQDIPELVAHFLTHQEPGLTPCRLQDDVMDKFMHYHWPGNIRELANVVERLCILYPGQQVVPAALPERILGQPTPAMAMTDLKQTVMVAPNLLGEGFDLKQYVQDVEVNLIQQALSMSQGVVSRAAHLLGIRRTTLVEKIKKYNIDKLCTEA